MKSFILALVAVSVYVSVVWSANYYVDAKNGKDSWDGLAPEYTSGSNGPWQHMSVVNGTALSAGDTIHLKRDGTYGQIQIRYAGSDSSHPITYTDYGTGAKPIIDPSQTLTSWSGGPVYTVSGSECAWLFEDGYALNHASDKTCANGNWYSDGVYIYYKATSGMPGDHTVSRTYSTNYGVRMTYIAGNNYIIFNNLKFVKEGFYNGDGRSITGMVITNCDFDQNHSSIYYVKAGSANSSIDITDCTFTNSVGIYLQLASNYNWTANIQRNTFTGVCRTSFGGVFSSGSDTGAILCQNLTGSDVSYNVVGDTYGNNGGFTNWTNAAETGNKIHHNFIHDIEGYGMCPFGLTDGGDAEVYDNIIAKCTKEGMRLTYTGDSSLKKKVYNNTVYGCTTNYANTAGGIEYYEFYNNISVSPSDSHVDLRASTMTNNLFNNNCYYPDGAFQAKSYTHYATVALWQAYTDPQENSSISANPTFLNDSGTYTEARDFIPTANVIGKGIDVGLSTDYQGNGWRNPPSMGAIEYSNIGGVISPRTVAGSHYLPK